MKVGPDRDGPIPKVKATVRWQDRVTMKSIKFDYQPKSWDEYDRIMAERETEKWKVACLILAILLLVSLTVG